MKKVLFTIALILTVTWSCEKELDKTPISIISEITVVARVGDEEYTKTTVHSDGSSILWTDGDAINLFQGTSI